MICAMDCAHPVETTMNRHSVLGRRHRRALALAALVLSVLPLAAHARADPPPGDYRIEHGKVDRGTYAGWRLFHSACYGCHGVGGGGTDLAPNLVERVKTLTPRAFAARVLTSYRIALLAGDANGEAQLDEVMRRERGTAVRILMPVWEADPKVNPHVLDVFAYLSARADGKLGPGKPVVHPDRRRPLRRAPAPR